MGLRIVDADHTSSCSEITDVWLAKDYGPGPTEEITTKIIVAAMLFLCTLCSAEQSCPVISIKRTVNFWGSAAGLHYKNTTDEEVNLVRFRVVFMDRFGERTISTLEYD